MQTQNTKVIVISGTKGGIGKTTFTANLGGFLSAIGKKVLLVDTDSQPALSDYYQLQQPIADYGLVDIFKQPSLVKQAISSTTIGCDIILSNDSERNIETTLNKAGVSDIKYRLRKALHNNIADLNYDFVIVDCPGQTSTIHQAAILAADLIVCPVTPDMMSFREFPRGTLSMIKSLEKDLAEQIVMWPDIAQVYTIVYRVDATIDSNNHVIALKEGIAGIYNSLKKQTTDKSLSDKEREQARQVLKKHDFMPNGGIITLDVMVPRRVVYQNATSKRLPVHEVETAKKHNNAIRVLQQIVTELPLGLTKSEINKIDSLVEA